jgi:hypothetical protein
VFDRGRIKRKNMSLVRTNKLHQMRIPQTRTAFRGSSAGWGK